MVAMWGKGYLILLFLYGFASWPPTHIHTQLTLLLAMEGKKITICRRKTPFSCVQPNLNCSSVLLLFLFLKDACWEYLITDLLIRPRDARISTTSAHGCLLVLWSDKHFFQCIFHLFVNQAWLFSRLLPNSLAKCSQLFMHAQWVHHPPSLLYRCYIQHNRCYPGVL